MKSHKYAVILLFMLFPALARAESFKGNVTGVTDGDTLEVMHDGRTERVRLLGVDCPELGQAFGSKAKEFTSDLCLGKQVTVYMQDKDIYGRLIADVMLPDLKSLNQEIVGNGMGWWFQQFGSHDTTLKDLEQRARKSREGLWKEAAPIEPWKFRVKEREKQPKDSGASTEKVKGAQKNDVHDVEIGRAENKPGKQWASGIAEKQSPTSEAPAGNGKISNATEAPKTVHVNGYYRKNGTYVEPHYRSPRRR